MSKQAGKTYIVTNAAEGWVQLSASKFLPNVRKELATEIEIISARSRYEALYPKNYQRWKVEAFLETRKNLEAEAVTNLIAFGDNMFEIEAAKILGRQFTKSLIKTVKFKTSPTPKELIKQINVVNDSFQTICNAGQSLTVRLEKKEKIDTN